MDSVSHRYGADTFAQAAVPASVKISRPERESLAVEAPSTSNSFASVESPRVKALLAELLMQPTLELKERPSHQFRAHLVNIGAELFSPNVDRLLRKDQLRLGSEAIEFLHLGSLIVDDIQDGSRVRRHGPSLHEKLGMPHALSVGNWLYFRALRLLDKLDLDLERRQLLNNEWHEAMEHAHYGQIMDLSLSVQQLPLAHLVDVCKHCALYKTGSITALAIGMGALLQGATIKQLQAIKKLGTALGIYLQQLNDIGNIIGECDVEKRFEDLLAYKPSFIWSFTLERFGARSLDQLFQATRQLPQATAGLEDWIARHDLQKNAGVHAEDMFLKALDEFQINYPGCDLTKLINLQYRIKSAYA